MRIIMIDDEQAMHLIMKRILMKIVDVEIVGCFRETTSAFSYLENHDADLVFIDISMPKESGLEFAQRLRASGKLVRLVFVTSHKEYALSAFDVYAYDYIVKPVKQDRIHQTVQRVILELQSEKIQMEQVSSTSKVMFNCLGGMDIRSVQNVVVKWKTSKSAELFGYLLMHKGRLVSRGRIIEDIFSEMPHKNAETYLNTTVYQLRKLLDTYGLKESLHSDNNHYALALNQVHVDMLSFEEGCKQMIEIDDTNIEQALELEQLYAGDLFGDRAFPWAWSEVERLWLLYTTFTHRLCRALLNKGDTQTAIRLLTKLTAHNELDEATIMLYMKALAVQKNKEALIRQYLHYMETLYKELGITPSPEVAGYYNQLLSELN
ncbi:response regulator [Paenibacillus psychroresistens]|uniref:Response regulator n=1 Tax=Paenibacillus psychroresistens TaxID=1778678 RepID=A0A6B8RQ60_9BACL|nr:response regulator [Paenibacillus psychroresistens]QGQ97526.1 response regulator [Paenibacillus psychroresistens]